MNRTTILLSALALSSCTTAHQQGLRKAAQLTGDACRAYLAVYPEGKGRVAEVCRKVVGMPMARLSHPETERS